MSNGIKIFWFLSGLVFFVQCQPASDHLNIQDFGAKPEPGFLNTNAIQRTIDKVAENGGTVVIPAGTFITGTIELRSNVKLHLNHGAVLLGSPNIKDYSKKTWGHNKDRQPWHLIYAYNIKNAAITGSGIIDGNGEAFWEEYEKDDQGNMVVPRWIKAKEQKISPLIDMNNCRFITVKDVEVRTGGGWNIHFFNSSQINISGVKVVNNIYSPNSDGIDLTGCSDVMISDCFIKTCDDAICLKTVTDSRETERVTINNCTIETLCVGVKLGAGESYKDMRDVTISNCTFNGSSRFFGLYSKNGGILENIVVNNLSGNTNAKLIYNRPIQLMVEKTGGIRNVKISNITAHTDGRILMTCDKEGFIRDVSLRDVTLTYPRVEDPFPMVDGARSNQFPKVERFPEAAGARAAIVAENIENLVIQNFQINWPDGNVPDEWRHPQRIENGTRRIHQPSYKKAQEVPFSVLWGKKLRGGFFENPLAKTSGPEIKKYDLYQSEVTIKN